MSQTFAQTRNERTEHFRRMIAGNQRWALRALIVVYGFQTTSERHRGATIEHNGAGFSGADSEILSSFAERVIAWNAETVHKYASPLSPKQMVWVHRLMPKYAAQLVRHLEASEAPAPVIVAAPEPEQKRWEGSEASDLASDIAADLAPGPTIEAAPTKEMTSADFIRDHAPAMRAPIDLVALARSLAK